MVLYCYLYVTLPEKMISLCFRACAPVFCILCGSLCLSLEQIIGVSSVNRIHFFLNFEVEHELTPHFVHTKV